VKSDCRIKKLVFLVFWPITALEEKKWHFKYLHGRGFEVKVFNLTGLLNSESLKKHPVPDALQRDFIHQINSYREFDYLLKNSVDDSLFIDYLVGDSDIDLKVEKVFRILHKNKARYAFISSGALPLPSTSPKLEGNINELLKNARKALNPLKLINFMVKKLILVFTRYNHIYPLPLFIFAGESDGIGRYVKNRGIAKDKIKLIHSFDYDCYLEFVRSNPCIEQNDICVFIDDNVVDSPDFLILGLKQISKKEYFSLMNMLFEHIERQTGLRVVIAAHPRSRFKDGTEFGNRAFSKGKTLELVAKSKMVVMHGSTAISFAALLKKPILIVKTPEMAANRHISDNIDAIANVIGVKPIVIESQESLSRIDFNFSDWETTKHDEYVHKYVKSRGVGELMSWEIVLNTIAEYNENTKTFIQRKN
jgi:hypothetical protein